MLCFHVPQLEEALTVVDDFDVVVTAHGAVETETEVTVTVTAGLFSITVTAGLFSVTVTVAAGWVT